MLISNNNNDSLFQFNQQNQQNLIEKKPVRKGGEGSYRNVNQNLSNLKKQFNKNMDGLVKIVAENIVYTFFNIDSNNMTDLITKYINWPIIDIVKSFTINYYIPHKNDIILKTFILYNINKIVNTVSDIIEITLFKNSGLINFNHDAFEDQIKQLRSQLEDKNKTLNERLGQLRNEINQKYDGGETSDIHIDDDMNVDIVDQKSQPEQAEDILRQNVQKSILSQYNKMLSDSGLSELVIATTKNDQSDDNLDLDKMENQQKKEQQIRNNVRSEILSQLGFTDIILGD